MFKIDFLIIAHFAFLSFLIFLPLSPLSFSVFLFVLRLLSLSTFSSLLSFSIVCFLFLSFTIVCFFFSSFAALAWRDRRILSSSRVGDGDTSDPVSLVSVELPLSDSVDGSDYQQI